MTTSVKRIFVYGRPGSGKTTVANGILLGLRTAGLEAKFFDETRDDELFGYKGEVPDNLADTVSICPRSLPWLEPRTGTYFDEPPTYPDTLTIVCSGPMLLCSIPGANGKNNNFSVGIDSAPNLLPIIEAIADADRLLNKIPADKKNRRENNVV